ncbi:MULTISPECIES: ABC transporter substrate-binding protein [unclassified Leptolyngbya]|uniref:ABC transporter substrate-binding protein n=1 Tax=unclassified Leptolyngbya TaxID=2650499 RepID=UPI0016830CA7|nr:MULTISPECIES: ABC transporter substrate-binding protein [unclassified Leptolyngbya]MBD1912005.1 amino acid ABC transporter substrate-binding protein [Leptolyngbya sp. FACHB-8]MBD2155375.1 amino acid ABC transporter substrate-binding protein [Leptolyngbya sp. FACHB-16]
MAKTNETSKLIVSLVITLALIGLGFSWLTRNLNLGRILRFGPAAQSPLDLQPTPLPTTVPVGFSSFYNPDAITRISQGGRLLFPDGVTIQKEGAVAALNEGDLQRAINGLEAALRLNRNDPEALIYLNNARIGSGASFSIAVAVPISTDPDGSREILRGVAQAQTEINQAGGMKGTPLRVYIANDEGDPEIAKQIAIALIGDPSILGVVGHYASDVTLAAGNAYDALGLVAISPVSTSVTLSNRSDYILRTVPSDSVAGSTLATYTLNTLQQQKAAVFYNSKSGYSESLKTEFISALLRGGGQVVGVYDLSAPNFDAEAQVQQAQLAGATVLALLPNTGQLDNAFKVARANYGRFALLGGDDMYTPKTLQMAEQGTAEMVVAVPWHILAHNDSPFVAASRQLWGGDVNWRTVTAYDATQTLIRAIQEAPAPTRQKIMETIRSDSFTATGATSNVQFFPSGDRNQNVQLVKVQPGGRSGKGFDFVPVP